MMRVLAPLAVLLLLTACSDKKDDAAPEAAPEEKDLPPRPEKVGDEPAVVTVKHVLIAYAGSRIPSVTRSLAEAETLAYDVLGWAKEGKDFDELVKDHSDDTGGGTYTLVNNGIERRGDEFNRSGTPRSMVKAFGDVAFRINVGEIGIAMQDPEASPYGFHVIKRLK